MRKVPTDANADLFGTDPHKLHRTGSPDTSVHAAYLVDTSRLERMVYEVIVSFGPQGCISDDIRARLRGLPYSSVTARYSALIDKGLIEDTGFRREGNSGKFQRIVRATTFKGPLA